MTTNATNAFLDGEWLDFYALLGVPVSADEETIRRRIGKVYTNATANIEHRDPQKRLYFQSLTERVLPQARRILLDASWRAKYDRQHILHSIGDPSAQTFVAFIAAMRGNMASVTKADQLPGLQDEISAAREVVECARTGRDLDLLPGAAIKTKAAPLTPDPEPEPQPVHMARAPKVSSAPPVEVAAPAPFVGEKVFFPQPKPTVHFTPEQEENAVRAKTLTTEQARDIRRRRESNVDAHSPDMPDALHDVISGQAKLTGRRSTKRNAPSRVVVGDGKTSGPRRILSPTALNLMVAITGVLFTLSIQRFAATPAVATSAGRMPVLLAAAPEIAPALGSAGIAWEKTGDGAAFDVVVQGVESRAGLHRALRGGDGAPDAWVPASGAAVEQFNALAPRFRRATLAPGESLARTPIVLLARADHAGELRRAFPGHRVSSWSALRTAVGKGAVGHFGICDPQKTALGALVRFSMLREWSESNGKTPRVAVNDAAFWTWMNTFEANSPSAYACDADLVNDLSQDGASRVWWGLCFESDALRALNAGQSVEVWYLPRTIAADHPFCEVERVGAPVEVAPARSAFQQFLRSDEGQKTLLLAGMRPSNLSLQTRVKGNPFTSARFQKCGVRASLPRDERDGGSLLPALTGAWAKRFK